MNELPLVGQSVSRVVFDYAITLLTDGGAELRFETRISVNGSSAATTTTVNAAAAADHASLLVGFLHRKIVAASLEDDGMLRLALSGGAHVDIAPDDSFEAWTFAGPNGEKAVCLPGGGLTTWNFFKEI